MLPYVKLYIFCIGRKLQRPNLQGKLKASPAVSVYLLFDLYFIPAYVRPVSNVLHVINMTPICGTRQPPQRMSPLLLPRLRRSAKLKRQRPRRLLLPRRQLPPGPRPQVFTHWSSARSKFQPHSQGSSLQPGNFHSNCWIYINLCCESFDVRLMSSPDLMDCSIFTQNQFTKCSFYLFQLYICFHSSTWSSKSCLLLLNASLLVTNQKLNSLC